MATVTLKTKGSAPGYAATVDFDNKRVADRINHELCGEGLKDTDPRIALITQDFVDRHGIKAYYVSGTFLNITLCEGAVNEFENF